MTIKMKMNMTPNEKYEAHLRYVLNKLKGATLYSDKNGIAVYRLDPDRSAANEEEPNGEQEGAILDQLRDKNVVEIKDVVPLEPHSDSRVRLDFREDVLFKPIEPMFSELYEQFPLTLEVSAFYIQYLQTREIILNGKYLLSKPDFMSENDAVFEFVYHRPNQTLTRDIIEKELKQKLKKKLYQIIDDLGFVDELKKVFFPNVSQNAIEFKNNRTEKDMAGVSINKKKMQTQLKKLKPWKK